MPQTHPTSRAGNRAAQSANAPARRDAARRLAHRNTIERLNGIRHLLAAAKGLPLTAGAIAEHFEVCTKTIYRDIESLRRMGAIKTWTAVDGLNVSGYILAEKSRCPFCGSPGTN